MKGLGIFLGRLPGVQGKIICGEINNFRFTHPTFRDFSDPLSEFEVLPVSRDYDFQARHCFAKICPILESPGYNVAKEIQG